VALEPLLPVTARYNVQIRGGVLSAEGQLEYSVDGDTHANLKVLTLDNVRVDYVHTAQTKAKETQVGQAAVKTAQKIQNEPETLIRIDRGELNNSEFGFINEAAKPPYRVFVTNATLHLENLSNHLSEGSAFVRLTGAFMGTGDTVISGTFRPERTFARFRSGHED